MLPFRRELYPPNWEQISAAIRERAGDRCEWHGCEAPNHALIARDRRNPERWELHSTEPRCGCSVCCGGWIGEPSYPVSVVLTTAHLDHTPANCDPSNLRAWCQLHHLRYDAALHAKNAAETRRRKRIDAGQAGLVPA